MLICDLFVRITLLCQNRFISRPRNIQKYIKNTFHYISIKSLNKLTSETKKYNNHIKYWNLNYFEKKIFKKIIGT